MQVIIVLTLNNFVHALCATLLSVTFSARVIQRGKDSSCGIITVEIWESLLPFGEFGVIFWPVSSGTTAARHTYETKTKRAKVMNRNIDTHELNPEDAVIMTPDGEIMHP